MPRPRVYLDNAATSWPKPPEVIETVTAYLRDNGAPAGRGAYAHALDVQQRIDQVRTQFARWINAPADGTVVFTSNGTDSLNLAIHGLLKENDRVVTTAAEHNSVLRPLEHEKRYRNVAYSVAPCDAAGIVDLDALDAALANGARLVVATHASNVTGALQPVQEIVSKAHNAGALVVLDCAQSLGHVPLDLETIGADVIAGSAHKGLLGILGLGVLYISKTCYDEMETLRQGGTGTQSENLVHPQAGVEKFEAGNLNVPGILALGAGLEFLAKHQDKHCSHLAALTSRLVEGLRQIQGVDVIGHGDRGAFTHVVSTMIRGFAPQDAAAILDAQFGVQVRAGFHCAPLIHDSIGSKENGGTVRFSLGPFNTTAHIDAAIAAVAELAQSVRT